MRTILSIKKDRSHRSFCLFLKPEQTQKVPRACRCWTMSSPTLQSFHVLNGLNIIMRYGEDVRQRIRQHAGQTTSVKLQLSQPSNASMDLKICNCKQIYEFLRPRSPLDSFCRARRHQAVRRHTTTTPKKLIME